MSSGSPIRGSRVGAGPAREPAKGGLVARVAVKYWCTNGHVSTPRFLAESNIEIPETWDCESCGLPAGRDEKNPPAEPRNAPYKTHLDYVRERRSDAEGAQLLEEVLQELRIRRGEK